MSKHLEPWTDGSPVRCKTCGGTEFVVMAEGAGAFPCPDCACGSPVEGGERRWRMDSFLPEHACADCAHGRREPFGHGSNIVFVKPCKDAASCTVRPSNWEER
jgi:hypothetical protein